VQYTPAIGDLLIREKALGIFDHVGVLVAPQTVLQNTPSHGEHLASVTEFAAGQPVKVQPTGANAAAVQSRARHVLARAQAYNPFSRNCEHTASEVIRGVARSPQLLFYVSLAVLAVVLFLILKRR
jgi:hypothetical protein